MAKTRRKDAKRLVQIALVAWAEGDEKITCARIPETTSEKVAFAFFLGAIAHAAELPQSVFGFRDELARMIDEVIAEGPISIEKIAAHARANKRWLA